mmetsp:Transcript_21413/g.41992  ORF Transcript_21413/g.41992 Transcript_21413/m.41992 type:complete len:360 (+) Transcript_21413:171-1250(+)
MGKLGLICGSLLVIFYVLTVLCTATTETRSSSNRGQTNRHTNNWAVIVDTSIFFFNYRHAANALSMYRTVKKLGIPDNQIILMLADDMACHPSNPLKAEIFNNRNRQIELYGENIEVDYRGEEVTVENFLRILLGRHLPGTPASKRLDTNEGSNIFIYLSGHGGDEFIKFQDSEEMSSQDIAGVFDQMKIKNRFNEIFFAVDTCQAATLYKHFQTDGVIAMGSSRRNENSYSHHNDGDLGTPVIDRFTYHMLEFMDRQGSKANFGDLLRYLTPQKLMSTAAMDTSHFSRPVSSVRLTDFLGSVLQVDTKLANAGFDPTANYTSSSTKGEEGQENDSQLPQKVAQDKQETSLYTEFEATF